jgi:hypothetical protein
LLFFSPQASILSNTVLLLDVFAEMFLVVVDLAIILTQFTKIANKISLANLKLPSILLNFKNFFTICNSLLINHTV